MALDISTNKRVCATLHAGQSGFGSRDLSEESNLSGANGERKTYACKYVLFQTFRSMKL